MFQFQKKKRVDRFKRQNKLNWRYLYLVKVIMFLDTYLYFYISSRKIGKLRRLKCIEIWLIVRFSWIPSLSVVMVFWWIICGYVTEHVHIIHNYRSLFCDETFTLLTRQWHTHTHTHTHPRILHNYVLGYILIFLYKLKENRRLDLRHIYTYIYKTP